MTDSQQVGFTDAGAFNDMAQNRATTSKHDDIAAATAAGVNKAHEQARQQGVTPGGQNGPKDAIPQVQAVPAAGEQAALDEQYTNRDSVYDVQQGVADADAFKAQADRQYGDA